MVFNSAVMKKIASQMKAKKKIQSAMKTEVEATTPKTIKAFEDEVDIDAHKSNKKKMVKKNHS